ncbi:hypothetical protein WJX73_000272 [Symbiochloris irregularis]|uniref:Uncharacterized protein n=1 Tax=Symbiochloris irregularis TaxID=706552 RepID=A0AAW1PUN7_9CHLO
MTDSSPDAAGDQDGSPVRKKQHVSFSDSPHTNGSSDTPHQSPTPSSSPQPPIQVSPFARLAQQPATDSPRSSISAGPGTMPSRAVSWQDMVGRDLVSVREFEPSEADGSESGLWGKHHEKGCCCIM